MDPYHSTSDAHAAQEDAWRTDFEKLSLMELADRVAEAGRTVDDVSRQRHQMADEEWRRMQVLLLVVQATLGDNADKRAKDEALDAAVQMVDLANRRVQWLRPIERKRLSAFFQGLSGTLRGRASQSST